MIIKDEWGGMELTMRFGGSSMPAVETPVTFQPSTVLSSAGDAASGERLRRLRAEGKNSTIFAGADAMPSLATNWERQFKWQRRSDAR